MQQYCVFRKNSKWPARKTDSSHAGKALYTARRACGEGISKGNIVPLGPPVGVRDPLRRGPGFLLLFSIKSKGESPCFAVKVLNGRTANVGEPFYFGATAPNPCEALLTLGSEKE